jgi:hypothetical protein
VPSEPIESAEEWGRRQAAAAPPWSEAKWRRICGLLRINIATPAEDAALNDHQADNEHRPGTEAA